MGRRLGRISLETARFALVPADIGRRVEEPNTEDRDIEAIYHAAHRQVFDSDPCDSVGHHRQAVLDNAVVSHCPVALYMVTCMHAHRLKTHLPFTSRLLTDGRALKLVARYSTTTRKKYAAFSAHTLELLGADVSDKRSLDFRMRETELRAATWIVRYKLWNPGLPFDALFDTEEANLDASWLASEVRYTERLLAYSRREIEAKPVRHRALTAFKRMKKYKHDAIATFTARERCATPVIREVLNTYGYTGIDFEIGNEPVSDPLLFWYQLALAIQHLECIRLVSYTEGIYAANLTCSIPH